MNHIVQLLVDRLAEKLTDICITDLADDDPTQADIVKAGRFQDDPVSNNIYVAISGGDPDDPTYKDGIVTLQDMDRIGFYAPVREIGGGQLWWRRGIIQIGCYFITEQLTEAKAMEYAYAVLGRVQGSLESIYIGDLVDDYGEVPIKLFTFGNTFFESGGPPSSYIWRGKVYWSCLTERP